MIAILFTVVTVLTFTHAAPGRNVCLNYPFLYNTCLPPTDWNCAKPKGFQTLDINGVMNELGLERSDPEYIHYLSTCRECGGNPDPYGEKIAYKKTPACREVKVPVEYVNNGPEVCQVVVNNDFQKVYRTECFNGDKRKNNQYCRFDYGTFKQFFCRPTNFITRKMLVFCPSSGLQYFAAKVSTACSCVKVGCKRWDGPINIKH